MRAPPFLAPRPPHLWGPAWLLQASTQKQLSSLRTWCSGKAPHCLVKKREAESVASPPLPSTMSGCLCSAQLEEAGGQRHAEPRGPQGPEAGPNPACWEGRGWGPVVSGWLCSLQLVDS